MVADTPAGTVIPRRVLIGTVSNYAGKLIPLATWFFLTPFILRHLGATGYGLWVLVGSVVRYGSLFDFGIAGAVIKYVAEYRTRGETEQARRLIATALCLYTVLGLIAIAISAVIAPTLPYLFNVPLDERATAIRLVLLMGAAIGISIPCAITTAVLRSLQRFDLANLVSIVGTLVSAAATVVVLLLGGGVLGMAVVSITVIVMMQVPSVWFIHRIAPELRFGWHGGSRKLIRTITSFSSPLFVMDVAGQLQTRTDEIVIAAFLPLSAVTPYSIARRLSEVSQLLANQFSKVLLPLASGLHAENDSARLRSLYITSSRLALAVSLAVGCTIIILARPILTVWVGPGYADYAHLVIILTLAGLINASRWPAGLVLQAIARHRPLAVMAIGSGLANLALSLALVRRFGLTGVAVGTLIPTAVECIGLALPYAMRIIGVTASEGLKRIFLPTLLPVIPMAIMLYVLQQAIGRPSLLSVMFVAGIGLLVYVIGYLSVGASQFERQTYRSFALNTFSLAKARLKASRPSIQHLSRAMPSATREPTTRRRDGNRNHIPRMRTSNTMGTQDTRSTVRAEKVFQWWDYPLFVLLTGASLAAIFYFMDHWFSHEDWLHYPVIFSILTLILIVNLANNQGLWFLLPFMKRPKPVTATSGWKLSVATSFVPGGESLEMLEKTVTALIALDYPHDTWVLDEGDNDQVKALCQRLGANHFSRKNLPQYQTESGTFQSHWKHGNYNAWLYEIGFDRYDVVTVFDPDHVPYPAYLSNVLGYFEDPKVAYVQVPQAYYNQRASFIARGAAEEVYSFYSSVQMASYGMGYPVVIGCHTTHRVIALKQVGGFPAHNADDILITLRYRARGWEGVYLPQVLARGLTPVDWNGYVTQQRRWARSVLDIKLRIYPTLSKKLPIRTRVISFLHGLNYLHKSLAIFLGLAVMAFMLATGITPKVFSYRTLPKLAILYGVLQVCEFYRQRFYLDWRNERGFHWRAAVLQYAKWPYLILALCDVLLNRRVPFALTRKVNPRSWHHVLLWPHMLVATLIGIAWIIGTVSGRIIDPMLHISAVILVMGSLALILSEHLDFPDPYTRALPAFVGNETAVNKKTDAVSGGR